MMMHQWGKLRVVSPEDSEVRKLAERAVLKIYRGAGQVLEYRV